jgi:hypothetical protein
MGNLKLIKNNISTEERINNRIEAFYEDIRNDYIDIEHIHDMLIVIQEYLYECKDEDLQFSALKVRESIFYVDSFIHN